MPSYNTADCPSGNTDNRAQHRNQALYYAELTPAQIEYWRVFFRLWEERNPDWMRSLRMQTSCHADGARVYSVCQPFSLPAIANCDWDEIIRAQILTIVESTPPNPAAIIPVKLSQPRHAATVATDSDYDNNVLRRLSESIAASHRHEVA